MKKKNLAVRWDQVAHCSKPLGQFMAVGTLLLLLLLGRSKMVVAIKGQIYWRKKNFRKSLHEASAHLQLVFRESSMER